MTRVQDDGPPLASVHHLPAPTGTDDDVVDAEVLTAEECRELDSQRGRALARLEVYRADVATVARTTRAVATHPRTVAVVRHGLYVVAGVVGVGRRLWDARTAGRYERLMRIAEATGNLEQVAEWETRATAFRAARHQRRMDLLALPGRVAHSLVVGSGTLLALLLGIGVVLAVAERDVGQVAGPLLAAAGVVGVVALVVTVVWGPLLFAAPWLAVLGLWALGRSHGTGPSWRATASDADVDVTIDETTIARALAALRIPQITVHLKRAPLQFLTTAHRDGRGVRAVVRLPDGVTAEKIAGRRGDLASGLHRLAKEVWPTTGSEEGILDLWIANKGALKEGAGPYPLLTDGAVDVFKGVPFGRILKGDPIVAPIMERNTIVGGIPGQGKSASARTMMLGAALDPTAELRIWIPDSNFDFEAFRPRCSRYVMGSEKADIEQIRDDLVELKAEVQSRGQLLVEFEVPEVTRALASKNVGLHPLVCLLEEAHVAIQDAKYGEEIGQLLADIVRLGRKRGIHLIISTQAPTKDSMPRDVTRNCSNGIAYAVGDHVANDALLGQGAYRAGHRATELIPGTDRGTAVVKGFSGERSELAQTYFVTPARGKALVTPIIQRSLAAIARSGRPVPGTDKPRETPAVEAPRDLLDDLDEVLGTDVVKSSDVPALLRELAPNWEPYQNLTGAGLRDQLAELGIKVPSTGNRYPLDPVTVREEIARRSTADLDE